MKLKPIIFSLLLVTFLISNSCRKEDAAIATIIDEGSIASDGCGWMVKIGDSTYHPDNLPEQYQVNNLSVSIKYRLYHSSWSCNRIILFNTLTSNNSNNTIHLYSIRKY
jgi:hypothetical protein